eukprot:CAMPEP_0167775668 /NCGR_PEP_ID=MMETSP0111_2-20121227/2691_1 /TAXON_ID=91324 /ORGANISM="Lotharella globosa, Strain CCCM811" /LENGTH=255 /DNA_ID=CAMNT_0007665617 /DNA_START=136 /DNA_END=903 /DNA_ORIENTATION=+
MPRTVAKAELVNFLRDLRRAPVKLHGYVLRPLVDRIGLMSDEDAIVAFVEMLTTMPKSTVETDLLLALQKRYNTALWKLTPEDRHHVTSCVPQIRLKEIESLVSDASPTSSEEERVVEVKLPFNWASAPPFVKEGQQEPPSPHTEKKLHYMSNNQTSLTNEYDIKSDGRALNNHALNTMCAFPDSIVANQEEMENSERRRKEKAFFSDQLHMRLHENVAKRMLAGGPETPAELQAMNALRLCSMTGVHNLGTLRT